GPTPRPKQPKQTTPRNILLPLPKKEERCSIWPPRVVKPASTPRLPIVAPHILLPLKRLSQFLHSPPHAVGLGLSVMQCRGVRFGVSQQAGNVLGTPEALSVCCHGTSKNLKVDLDPCLFAERCQHAVLIVLCPLGLAVATGKNEIGIGGPAAGLTILFQVAHKHARQIHNLNL